VDARRILELAPQPEQRRRDRQVGERHPLRGEDPDNARRPEDKLTQRGSVDPQEGRYAIALEEHLPADRREVGRYQEQRPDQERPEPACAERRPVQEPGQAERADEREQRRGDPDRQRVEQSPQGRSAQRDGEVLEREPRRPLRERGRRKGQQEETRRRDREEQAQDQPQRRLEHP